MSRRKRLYETPVRRFNGGEASVYSQTDMPTKFARILQNMHITEKGGIGKIPGYVKVNTDGAVAETLYTGYEYIKKSGVTERLIAGGGKIFKEDGTALTAIKTGLDANAKVYFSTSNDLCIMSNGVDAMMKYDGTTVSALGGTPPTTGFKSVVHAGRVWIIERSDKMKATHSALEDPEDYTGAGAGSYAFQHYISGDELLDIASYIDLLIFFFRNHILIYSGQDPTATGDFRIVQKVKDTGVVETGTVQELGTDITFLHDSGVKTLKQVVTTGSLNADNDVSDNVDPSMRVSIASASNFSVAHYPAQGWMMLLIGATVWVYSYTWKAWGRIVGADINGLFSCADGSVYLCGTGWLYKYGSGWSFADTDMSIRWEPAWIRPFKNGDKAYPKQLDLIMKPGASVDIVVDVFYDLQPAALADQIQFSTDFGASLMDEPVSDIWENVFYMDHGAYDDIRLPMSGSGKTLSFAFQNTSSFGPIEVNEILVQADRGDS